MNAHISLTREKTGAHRALLQLRSPTVGGWKTRAACIILDMVTYLGLGSNLGDRETYLRTALGSLNRSGVKVLRTASLYWTEPRDFADQPWFLNTVIEANTDLEPHSLLLACLAIEQAAGRKRDLSKGPRSIDIDLLLYGRQVIDTPDLALPHPRYAQRRFVLVPLVQLAPDFVDPVQNLTLSELLRRCPDPGVVQFYGPPLF